MLSAYQQTSYIDLQSGMSRHQAHLRRLGPAEKAEVTRLLYAALAVPHAGHDLRAPLVHPGLHGNEQTIVAAVSNEASCVILTGQVVSSVPLPNTPRNGKPATT